MKIIINADDFGLCNGVNAGICRAMLEGVVTSTTWMANMPAAELALTMARAQGIDDIGQHLVLTCGRPVLPIDDVPSLVDSNGMFYRDVARQCAEANTDEVEREWRAQLLRGRQLGLTVNHLDSHHHIHMAARFADIFLRLAVEMDVPVRLSNEQCKRRQPDLFMPQKSLQELAVYYQAQVPTLLVAGFYGDRVVLDDLLTAVDEYSEQGVPAIEFMSHPAIVDDDLLRISSYNYAREKEFDILTSAILRTALWQRGCQLVGFNAFKKN